MPSQLQCPICRKPVASAEPDFPFCSERCRVIDLGKWASGDYRISVPITDPEELPEAAQRHLAGEDEA